jgi:hypothetical protein
MSGLYLTEKVKYELPVIHWKISGDLRKSAANCRF